MTPRVAVTLGDPRGIGPEVVAKALAASPPLDATFTIIGPADLVSTIPRDQDISVGRWQPIDTPHDAVEAGRLAGHAIERATQLALAGEVDAIVTAPIEKRALHLAGFRHRGHTEWLAELAGVDVAMMLASDALRVALVTTHVALKDVPALVTVDEVVRTGRITLEALQNWWGIAEPRLASVRAQPARRRGRAVR